MTHAGKRAWPPRRILEDCYLILMGILLLWYLYSIATFVNQYRTPVWVIALRCVAAGLAVYLGRLWKDRGFLALAALWGLMLVRAWFPNNWSRLSDKTVYESLWMGVWLFGACYGLGQAADPAKLKRFLKVMIAVWSVGMVVYSLIGLYASWTDQPVYTLSGRAKWFTEYGRLNLVFYSNTGASLLCVSALILLCAALQSRRRWIYVLSLPAILIMLVAICLTDSRTVKISFALGFAGMISLSFFRRLQSRHPSPGNRSRLLCGACFLLLMGIQLLIFEQITAVFNFLKLRGGLLLSTAHAETASAGAGQIVHRGLWTGASVLSGREDIWAAVLRYLLNNPKYLLLGTSLYQPMTGPNALVSGLVYSHAHSTPLQILLECGIPGLLLAGFFFLVMIRRSFRLIKAGTGSERWLSLLPPLVLSVLVGDLVECFLVLQRPYTPQQALIFICMGLICAFGVSGEKKPKKN